LKLSLEVSEGREATVIYCKGRLVYRDEAAALSGKVSEILPETRQLVLDLSGVESIDSAGLGELIAVRQLADGSGCPVRLAAPSRRVQGLLHLTKLTSIFEVFPTLEDALLSWGQPA
jgi:anti-anti-sigma factor